MPRGARRVLLVVVGVVYAGFALEFYYLDARLRTCLARGELWLLWEEILFRKIESLCIGVQRRVAPGLVRKELLTHPLKLRENESLVVFVQDGLQLLHFFIDRVFVLEIFMHLLYIDTVLDLDGHPLLRDELILELVQLRISILLVEKRLLVYLVFELPLQLDPPDTLLELVLVQGDLLLHVLPDDDPVDRVEDYLLLLILDVADSVTDLLRDGRRDLVQVVALSLGGDIDACRLHPAGRTDILCDLDSLHVTRLEVFFVEFPPLAKMRSSRFPARAPDLAEPGVLGMP